MSHTPNIFAYRALISSAHFSTPRGSPLSVLISLSALLPGFCWTSACTEWVRAKSTSSCWDSREFSQFWKRRAALGFGAALNSALGPVIRGAPSVGYDFYRLPLLLELDEIVLIAIGHHGALAESDLLRSIGRGLNLHHSLLGELLKIPPAELAHNLERSRHDGAAVGGMRLNHLPRPLWVKQVREAPGCLLRLYQCRVIAERGQPHACRNEKAVRIVIFLRIVARDLLRQIRNEPAVSLPHDAMGSVCCIDYINRIDAAVVFLLNALEQALGARALDAHSDAGEFGFENSADALSNRQIHRGVESDLALLLGHRDQCGRDFRWLGYLGTYRCRKNGCGIRSSGLEHVASR